MAYALHTILTHAYAHNNTTHACSLASNAHAHKHKHTLAYTLTEDESVAVLEAAMASMPSSWLPARNAASQLSKLREGERMPEAFAGLAGRGRQWQLPPLPPDCSLLTAPSRQLPSDYTPSQHPFCKPKLPLRFFAQHLLPSFRHLPRDTSRRLAMPVRSLPA